MSQQLNGRQRTFLRALAHHLEPVVQVGRSGATPAVLAQIAEQLLAHELIKVKFGKEAPEDAAAAADAIVAETKSLVVMTAGRVLVLYRRHDKKPRIQLPTQGKEGREGSDVDGKPKKDPKKSLNRLHAAKRARGEKKDGFDAADAATEQKPERKSVLSRLRAPRAGNAQRRSTVAARRRGR